MALETLKGVKKIGGFEVVEGSLDPHDPIYVGVNHEWNTITFKIQDRPIKEIGVNGCQVDTIIETAKLIIEGLNAKFPCRENAMVITKLDEALLWSMKRKLDREARGVEGISAK